MVAGAKDSNQAIAAPLSAEDEASKRNTDCVYFLASPLTCKKGSECEYRHSEHARVNPRDCWFWLNGSCLNSKCPFRHPPLDGLLGAQPSLSAGPALPMRQPATASTHAAVQAKQAVPCIFFQKGLCLKGDKCAFLHGSNSVATKPLQVTPPAAEITGQKSAFGVPQRKVQETTLYQPNISSSNKFTDVNLVRGMSGAPQKANVAKRVVIPSRGLKDKSLSYNSTSVAPLTDGMHEAEMPDDQVISNDDQIMSDGKDPHNLYRESSPGFDVLVDDVLAEDQYFDEDQYGTGLADHEMFHDPRVYDDFERLSGQNERDEIRRSSEIMLRGTTSLEGRNDRKGDTDRISQSDLRYRLKQRKDSGLRSIVSNDHSRGSREERRSGDHRRDSRLVAPLESSLSSRLQGRIKDPRRSPARRSVTDRDTERVRKVRRTSPVKTQIRDRIGSRVQDDFEQEKNLRGYGTRREGSENGWSEFSGPKRLSELKACKSSVKDRLISGQESFSLGKRKGYGEQEQLDSNLSFEGPKPLSEILKMKKRSELNVPESGSSENKKTKETVSDENRSINEEEHQFVADVSPKNLEPDQIQPSDVLLNTNQDNLEGIITDEGMEDQNLDGFDQGEDGEEYYYEEDGGEYNLEEGENAEGEYVEEEDGDDFEKKIGGMFS